MLIYSDDLRARYEAEKRSLAAVALPQLVELVVGVDR